MRAAGKTVVRLGADEGMGEQHWRQGGGGFHHAVHALRAGVENWPVERLILDGVVEYGSGDAAYRGSWQFLFGARAGVRVNAFRFGEFDQHGIDFIPAAEGGVGRGTFRSEEGFNPAPGFAATARLGAFLVYSHAGDEIGFDAGPGARCGHSFSQDFYDCIVGLEGTVFWDPTPSPPPDDCYQKLAFQKNLLASQIASLTAEREALLVADSENAATSALLQKFAAQQGVIHQEVRTYCPKGPRSPGKEYASPEIEPLPESFFVGLACPEELKAVDEAQGKAVEVQEGYEKVKGQLASASLWLQGALQWLLNWPPLECSPIPDPPRFLLFANDNPDVDLNEQWRNELGEFQRGAMIFSNPTLDEIILHLHKHPEVRLRLIATANDTSDDRGRDQLIAEERLASVVEYLTVRGKGCKEGPQGRTCEYVPHAPRIDSAHAVRGGKAIGGAFLSPREGTAPAGRELKRVALGEERFCKVQRQGQTKFGEAYTAQDLFDEHGLRPEVRRLYPPSVWQARKTSPIFRSVLIELVEGDRCPDSLLAEGGRGGG